MLLDEGEVTSNGMSPEDVPESMVEGSDSPLNVYNEEYNPLSSDAVAAAHYDDKVLFSSEQIKKLILRFLSLELYRIGCPRGLDDRGG